MSLHFTYLWTVSLTGWLLVMSATTYAQTPSTDTTNARRDSLSTLIPTEEELSISDLTLQIEEGNQQLHKIHNELLSGHTLSDIFLEFPDLSASIYLLLHTIQQENLAGFNLNQLDDVRNKLQRYHIELQAWQTQILNRAERLSQYKRQIGTLQKRFSDQKALLQDTTLMPLFQGRSVRMLEQAKIIEEKVNTHLGQVVTLQNNIADQDITLNNYLEDISFYIINYQKNLVKKDALPLWQLKQSTDENTFFSQISNVIKNGKNAILNYINDYKKGVYWQLGIFILLLITLHILKEKAYRLNQSKQVPHLARILYVFDKPWASALLFTLVLSPLIYLHPPILFIQIFYMLMLVPLLLIVWGRKYDIELKSVTLFSVAYFLSEIEVVLLGQSLGQRILLLFAALIAMGSNIIFLYQTYKNPKPYPEFFRWILFTVIGMFFIAVIANVLGYEALSSMLTHATTQSIIFGILVFIAYRILCGIILMIIYSKRVQRSQVIKENQLAISANLFQVFSIVLGLYWIGATLMNFNLYDYVYDTLSTFLLRTRMVGSVEFTIWSIVIFLLLIWASVTISKLIKYLLEQQYLSSTEKKSKKGAMILLIRYFTLLFGFFLAIAAAGIPLDKITIILGALSVGIGFGLQNIINNLVSGFILALERPIQTGDIIEVGSYKGVVKDIGIRSSTVKTFDGAEVIIPNASFISGDVTNWTLSDKHRRIEIMVGVSYSSHPPQVIEVLKQAIESQEEVMTVPQPMILFNDFGDSSLNFRLLFWVANMENFLTLRSKVMEEIYKRLDEAHIEIPFPQRDLHIKSGLPEMNGQKNHKAHTTPARKPPSEARQ